MIKRIQFSLRQRLFWRLVRKRKKAWQQLAADTGTVVTPLTNTLQIRLDLANELSAAIYCGEFEWAEREWLTRAIKPGAVVYDIGANIGYMTLLLADLTGPSGQVIALEPVATTFAKLTHNVQLNAQLTHVRSFNVAASDADGEQRIYLSAPGKDAWNSMVGADGAASETITAVRLDELIRRENLPAPALLKIDVEGWEINVLHGARETLRKHRPLLLVEFTAENLHAAGSSCRALANELQALDYTLSEYDPMARNTVPVADFSFAHKNLIATPVLR